MEKIPTSKPEQQTAVREDSLDFLRGVAVFLMILAHGIFYFYNGSNPVMSFLARTGNGLCFSLFLFVSGAAISFSYLKSPEPLWSHKTLKHLKRIGYLLLGYFVIALISQLGAFKTFNLNEIKNIVFQILTFQLVPGFTEFLIPLVFFSLIVIPFKKIFNRISQSLLLTILIGLGLYILGYILFPVQLSGAWQSYKALLTGDQVLLRFPILQYSFVFLFGNYWGTILRNKSQTTAEEKRAYYLSLGLMGIVIINTFISNIWPIQILEPLKRWPPSITFLLIGLSISFLFYVIFLNIRRSRLSSWIGETLNYLGRDAFDLFLTHLLLLFLYGNFGGRAYGNILIAVGLLVVLYGLSIFISSLNFKTSPSLFTIKRISFSGKSKYRPKKRHLLIALASMVIVFYNLNYRTHASPFGEPITVGENQKPLPALSQTLINEGSFNWFDTNYGFVRQISIENTSSLLPINAEDYGSITIDHQLLTKEKKSQADGNDLIVVYYRQSGYEIIPLKLENVTTKNTVLSFPIKEKIFPQKYDNHYFLYYGSDFPDIRTQFTPIGKSSSYLKTAVSNEYVPTISLSTNRHWLITEAPGKASVTPLVATVESSTALESDTQLYYHLDDTNISGEFDKLSDKTYQAVIKVQDFPTGTYHLYAYVKSGPLYNQTTTFSRKVEFEVSKPVMIAWTLDWEGWDVPTANLQAIETVVNNHNKLPLTHFFNPRIYINGVTSKERAEYLTNWIKNRSQVYGDEIGLHLHMQYNVVESAGVEVKKEPKWGGYTDGYDVMTTAYSKEEIAKIISWGKEQFKAHNLPTPMGYRAGGWFADEKVLQILENEGFTYDSSGRQQQMWSGTVKSPWNLQSSTQPFYPDKNNQNITSQNHWQILELPNNGGDCWGYTYEAMASRLKTNFDGKTVSEPKTITFLGHPQYFLDTNSQDNTKMDKLLADTDKFLYENDSGPIFYVTLSDIYNLYR